MNPISLVILGTLGMLVVLWLRSLPAGKRIRAVFLIVLVLLSLLLILLTLTGRLHWVAAVFAGILPFARHLFPIILRVLPFLKYFYKRRQSTQTSTGNQSEVQTRILSMQLDHDSGVMYGSIKEGPLQGHELGNLSEKQFIQLLEYCRQHEAESARLLETYLDKRFGDSWRQDDLNDQGSQTDSSAAMDNQRAYQILGLEEGCSREDIIDAHRKLMQKNHPDRGGSHYLAAQINQAKDYLLKGFNK